MNTYKFLSEKIDQDTNIIWFENSNNYKIKFPNTILFSLHKIDLIDGFTRVIALKNGEIYFDILSDELRKSHLEDIY